MNRLAKRLPPIAILAAVSGPLDAQARGRDVILATDCGAEIDDQFTIAHLSLVPEIHIRGIPWRRLRSERPTFASVTCGWTTKRPRKCWPDAVSSPIG